MKLNKYYLKMSTVKTPKQVKYESEIITEAKPTLLFIHSQYSILLISTSELDKNRKTPKKTINPKLLNGSIYFTIHSYTSNLLCSVKVAILRTQSSYLCTDNFRECLKLQTPHNKASAQLNNCRVTSPVLNRSAV